MLKKIKIVFIICFILQVSHLAFAAKNLDEAWNYFLKGNYKKAIKKADADKEKSPLAHYIMGLSYLKLGNPPHARRHFTFIVDMYPDFEFIEEATLSTADSYFLEGDFKAANIKYTEFLKKFPHSDLKDAALLKSGQSQRRLGMWPESKASLSNIIKDFPDSPSRKEAQKELQKEFYFYIQIEAFRNKNNAYKMLKALKKKGFDAYIDKTLKDDRLIYRIRVGRFDKRAEAQAALRRLKARGYSAKVYP